MGLILFISERQRMCRIAGQSNSGISNSEKEKYYWNTTVIFVGRDLNKALIRYLENRFVEIAKECGRYMVLTKNTYKNTVLKEARIASMEEFIDNVKILVNTLGYKVLW